MQFLSSPVVPSVPKLTTIAIIDILLTALLLYQFLIIIKGRRAAHVLYGITMLVGLYVIALVASLELMRTLLERMAPYTALAIIVIFQAEIRRVLTKLGRRTVFGFGSRLTRKEFVDEILSALEQLSKTKTGALIVMERDVGLRSFAESGVNLDAVVTRDLLLAIFQEKGALHDGAVIIQSERLAAAACFLPLSMNPALLSTMGTRHRAAIGVTEDSDCLSLVVSEETGVISAASFGEIERDLTLAQLEAIIAAHMGGRDKPLEDDVLEPAAEPDATTVKHG